MYLFCFRIMYRFIGTTDTDNHSKPRKGNIKL